MPNQLTEKIWINALNSEQG